MWPKTPKEGRYWKPPMPRRPKNLHSSPTQRILCLAIGRRARLSVTDRTMEHVLHNRPLIGKSLVCHRELRRVLRQAALQIQQQIFRNGRDDSVVSRVFGQRRDGHPASVVSYDRRASGSACRHLGLRHQPAATRQQFEGWGISLCWWANMCGKWSDEKIDELVDWLVSPDGLDLPVFSAITSAGETTRKTGTARRTTWEAERPACGNGRFKDSPDGEYIWSVMPHNGKSC